MNAATTAPGAATALLDVQGLTVAYGPATRPTQVVRQVSFAVRPGETLGIVGESGSGKTQTALAVLGLLARGGRTVAGRVLFEGSDLLALPAAEMRRLRGRSIAFVSQDAMSALNPVMSIGAQMAEPLIFNDGMDEEAALARCTELLDHAGIPGARARLASFPHQLSGGMRQRVLIAMAISGRPKLLIADEPTTALDVTLQAQILALIDRLRRELGMALVLISHDLGVVAGVADRIAIMYAGRVVELGAVVQVFEQPRHPYTRALLAARPRLDLPREPALQPIPGRPPDPARLPTGCAFHPRCALRVERCSAAAPELAPAASDSHLAACWRMADLAPAAARAPAIVTELPAEASRPVGEIAVEDLRVHFPVRSAVLRRQIGTVRAVDGVSLSLRAGETLGLVGESGSGKTTTGRALVGLAPVSGGRISYFGRDATTIGGARGALARLGQMVFQDPYGSLNPRLTVGAALGEVLAVHGLAARDELGARVDAMLEDVGLRPEVARRHPHQLSGGQRQRIAIARALAIEPRFVVCDEVVSALDVSIQGQIVNLLAELQRRRGITYLFISHDLGVVRQISHRIAVMYGGRVMESAPRERLFAAPRHPYTHALLAAVPIADPKRERARVRPETRAETPDPADPPPGCRFQRACRFATEICRGESPAVERIDDDHLVACHRWASDEVRAALTDGLARAP